MKTISSGIHDVLAVAFIAAGLLSARGLQFPAHAQQPAASTAQLASASSSSALRLQNGKLDVRQVSGSLSTTVNSWASASTKPEWLGYSVATVNGDRSVCCGDGSKQYATNCGPCRLEAQNYSESISSHDSEDVAQVNLEAPRELAILFRAESGKITRVRLFSIECKIDAGGLNVTWLQAVKSPESVSLLETFVRRTRPESRSGEDLGQSSLTAIALHADPAADRALQSFVAASEPVSLRRETAFWLGEARGAEGLRLLQKMAQTDPSPEVREQVTFALSVSNQPGALPEMIRMAHEDQSSQVRGQALFWLGQKAGEKAAKAITGSIDSDPDTDVKKKAVFALSQMPPEQGVPKLIQVAQSNRNPQIRKEAMFWLGQSEDPQALAFFEKVLTQ